MGAGVLGIGDHRAISRSQQRKTRKLMKSWSLNISKVWTVNYQDHMMTSITQVREEVRGSLGGFGALSPSRGAAPSVPMPPPESPGLHCVSSHLCPLTPPAPVPQHASLQTSLLSATLSPESPVDIITVEQRSKRQHILSSLPSASLKGTLFEARAVLFTLQVA